MGRYLYGFVLVFFGGLSIIIFPWQFWAIVLPCFIIAVIGSVYCEKKYGKRWFKKIMLKKKQNEAVDDFDPV